ncbi:MAG: HAD family hydrolase [Anaerolineae bacterium]|nr:HAD family hydrolase [Anaerolineae bacterium]
MPLVSPSLNGLRAFILDMDGVLYEGEAVLPGAVEFITRLQATGTPFLMLTNNAVRTPGQYVAKLARMGMSVAEDRIFTSALATADYLAGIAPGARVLVVGQDGLLDALRARGLTLVTHADDKPEFVVAGLDMTLTYDKLREATWAIRRGATFIASNPDVTYPTERGEAPGAGAVVAALQAASGVVPRVIGKPEPGIFAQVLARLGTAAQETAMVGDRMETDIVGGARAGLRTILVLTGVTREADLPHLPVQPDWVFPDLTALAAAWRKT